MINNNLKSRAVQGFVWNSIEKFAVQGIQFIIGIILARILMPSDYGLIGMLAIFIAISQWFIDSGFSTALIQKKNRSEIDFSTVFYFNIVVSILFYLILYFCSPLIADFYNQPKLVDLTKVLSLNIIISSFSIIQTTKFTINLDFKSITISNFIAVIISGSVGVTMAYVGFGVWALVWQSIIRVSILAIILWVISKWKPGLVFSMESFRNLFKFGSKLLAAGMIATILRNIYSIIIGKYFAAQELGYFTRAKGFTDLTSLTVTSILSKVSFPVLAEMQDDKKMLVSTYKRLIRMTSFVIFPLMALLAVIAEPFIRVLLTEKWIGVVPLLQLLCLARVLTPISTLNMNILNVIGRSDLFLKLDVIKVPIILGPLLIAIPFGVKAVVIGHVISSVISYLLNTYYPSKFYQYGAINQIKDIRMILLATLIMTIVVGIVGSSIDHDIIRLLVSIALAGIVYFIASYLLRIEELHEVKSLIMKLKKR